MKQLKIKKEFKELIRPLTEDEYSGLEDSIQKEGCRDAIVIWNDFVVDGHNRYEICQKLNQEFETKEAKFESDDEAMMWMIDNQMSKRNITPYERTEYALRFKEFYVEIAMRNQQQTQFNSEHLIKQNRTDSSKELFFPDVVEIGKKPLKIDATKLLKKINVREEVAKKANVSEATVRRVEMLQNVVTPEEKADLISGDTSINKIFEEHFPTPPKTSPVNVTEQSSVNIFTNEEKLNQMDFDIPTLKKKIEIELPLEIFKMLPKYPQEWNEYFCTAIEFFDGIRSEWNQTEIEEQIIGYRNLKLKK